MTIKKILFLSHDPGGHDVIKPLVDRAEILNLPHSFYGTHTDVVQSGTKFDYTATLSKIEVELANNEFCGLVTGTSWGSSLEQTVIQLFEYKGVPTLTVLDYWSNYMERLEIQDKAHIFPTYYIVMDEIAREEAVDHGVPESIIRVLGHPGMDTIIQRSQSQIKSGRHLISDTTMKVLFLSQPLSVLYGNELGFTEKDAIEDCLSFFTNNHHYTFDIKLHPKDQEYLKVLYKERLVEGQLLDLLPNYHLIIGMSTMGLLHSYLMGVPALSYQPNLQGNDTSITSKLNLLPAFYTKEKLYDFFNSSLVDYINLYEIKLKKNQLLWLDGNSTVRVIAFIKEVFSL
ncbi:hypothetical protein [Paenibacillus andongensis]|uniref:hypothetical protein n=1 Tax=Paenibacillus andongensis TaxID=2975482 RepID=UPI0021BAA8A0|nr:hypothetical protein [Paenibacillus andongensis]